LNVEQEITDDIGFFARAGWNDGNDVSWAFTEIDRTISGGFSIKGIEWKRSRDVLGIGAVINGISPDHQTFLEDGGYGFIIGDGKLNYGHEQIIEAYYNAMLSKFFWLTLDYQFVKNPGYNKDRGPVNVFGIRGHIEL
jgi:high affinity Mn2+ porin